ncbi:MAG: L-threonate dehydrogenase [Pseudomonadota bacterium]
MVEKVAVIGLGSMGYGIAQSCVRAGFETWGRDLNADRVARLKAEGGAVAPLQIANLDAVLVVVLNDAQAKNVLFGQAGLANDLRPGAVVVGCSTVPPDFAKDVAARLATLGVYYLDAPISGGAAKAADGALSIMASGPATAFAAARPVLDAISETVFELGDVAGPGSAVKAVNQMLAGVHIAAVAEALTFGMTQGVAPTTFVDVISKCAGTSWMLENRAPHIVDGDYTPRSQVNIWPKDLGIVLEIAKASGFPAPITEAALDRFSEAVKAGLGHEDDAAVAKVYAAAAGLKLPEN